MRNHCLSGGAVGADTMFGSVASEVGHVVTHFSYKNHRVNPDVPIDTMFIVPEADLAKADPYLAKANAWIKRNPYPRSYHVRSLIRRNYYQVAEADRVYAVAPIKNGLVDGGTAWAVYMFIDRYPRGEKCPVYVFDTVAEEWVTWSGDQWVKTIPPKPEGTYAGVGSRDLPESGTNAILDLYFK